MNTRMNEVVGEEIRENLFNQTYPSADVFTVLLRAGQGVLARGALLAKSSSIGDFVIIGTPAASGETLTANCILADDADTGTAAGAALSAVAYRTGHFNGNKLAVNPGYTITDADKETLRTLGILLSDAAEYKEV